MRPGSCGLQVPAAAFGCVGQTLYQLGPVILQDGTRPFPNNSQTSVLTEVFLEA